MSYQTNRTSKRSEWIVLICTAVALLFLPARLKTETVRHFSQPLTIQTSKTSPPRVAFHETIDRTSAHEAWIEETKNTSSQVDLNEALVQKSAVHGLQAVRYKKLVLSPMQVPREKALEILDRQTWMENLPAGLQGRLQEAQFRSQTMDQDWTLPTEKDLLEEKIREIEKQTSNEKASSVYVAAQAPSGAWITPKDLHNQSGIRIIPEDKKETTEDSDKSAETGKATFGTSSLVPNGRILVQGNLDLNMDTAFGPGRHLEVHWFDDGIAKEPGQVDLKKGRYAIYIPAKTGTVVAQLIDDSGTEVGSGQYRVSENDSTEKLQKASISIRPRSQVAGNFYNFSKDEPARSNRNLASIQKSPSPQVLMGATGEELSADSDGQLKAQGIAQGSWTLLRTELKGYYPSLHIASAGNEKSLPLFSEKMMQALLQIARENNSQVSGGETGSIIWGRVEQGGQGLSGVQVEIEGWPEAKPIYFFSGLLLPDQKAKATSSDGYFAFVDMPRGFHSLRLKRGIQQVGFANVETDDKTVSPVTVNADPMTEKVPVKVFDAFTGEAQIADVEFQQLNEGIEITGFAQIEVPHQDALSLAQVNPKNQMYVPTVNVFSAMDDHVHLPLIRADWIQSLKASQKVNDSPETGIIVGFVPGDDYEIDLPHAPDFDRSQILYFDAQGRPAASGVAGGGFLVFNAPPGSHAITLLPKKGNVLHTRIAPIDPGTVNVLKFDF